MAELHYITTGDLRIELDGLTFGKHLRKPVNNVGELEAEGNKLLLKSEDMDNFTDWGIIELKDIDPGTGFIIATIDSTKKGGFGSAQIALFVNGTCILNDNFQSEVSGHANPSVKTKKYPVGHIG